MALVACGLNANGQITPAGPPLLCCPTPVRDKKDVCEVHIACSHILWKTSKQVFFLSSEYVSHYSYL